MAIPVTRDELANGVFTSIAKYAARHWPGEGTLTLAPAQNLVAASFGYDDLHDLQKRATDKLPANPPTLAQAQAEVARNLVDRFGLASDTAAAFARHWPLSKLRFSQATAGGVDCPVTRHRQWRYLLRDLAPLPTFRWLSTVATERAMISLQPVAALARAVAMWEPALLERDQLALDLIGATEIECFMGGRLYGLLPQFWNRPDMRIDLRLVGLETQVHGLDAVPPGLPAFAPTIVRRRFGDYRHADNYRRPDATIVANPGLLSEFDNWLISDDGLLEEAARHPLLWLGYDWDDAELDQMTMQAFGLRHAGDVDRNPFFVEGSGRFAGTNLTYGMASWRSGPGLGKVTDAQRDRLLRQLERVDEFATTSDLDVERHNAAVAQVRALGEQQLVEQADGAKNRLIVLGRRYYARDDNGDIVRLPAKGALPQDTGLKVAQAWLAAYPAADARWIDRACWAAQVWLDQLDEYDAKFLFRPFSNSADNAEEDWYGNGLADLFKRLDPDIDDDTAQQLHAALVPAKRKPIRPEHKPFMQALNNGDLAGARAMLEADSSLAAAENDEGQTALYYAAREGNLALARAFVAAGGDTGHTDREHWTALMDAARHNRAGIIEWLTANGAAVDAGHALGWTPLQVALTNKATEAAVALARAGADLDRRTVAGWSAREFAIELGMQEVIEAAPEHTRRPRNTRRSKN